ncbi:unnamed protein product [Caenorhabditis brenneri]
MKLAPKIISGRLVVHPCLSCENETVFRLRAYFNILKKDGSSGCKIAFNSLYLSDNETIEAYMDVEALLDEKNGFLDDGSLTVEYGLQFESQKYDEDGIWRFNLSDVFYDWKNQDNMFIFLIDYDTDKIPVFAHRQIVKLHSKKIFDFNENWVRGPNDNSLDDYDVNDCLQITHGVKLTSIFDISKIARIASHYGFCNTIRYCEQQLIETDEQPKVTIQNFKLAIECGMKCYLYPHSPFGRFMAVVYSLLMIPIYIAFKFEFGTFLAHILVVASTRIGNKLKHFYNKSVPFIEKNITERFRVKTRLFARIQLNPDPPNSSLHRDHLIFLSSILVCSISLLSCSLMFSIIENISFSSSIYFGIITMSLIGLGDIVPTNLIWFSVYCLFFLICDVLSNQIFYFCQARVRFFFHCLARKVLLWKSDDNDFGVETTVSLQNVPVVNTQCMPSLVMDCEKEELDKDEKLLSSLTSLSKEQLLFQ